jgi:hypothetical protein
MPFTLHTTLLIVIVAVFKMPLRIPGTARHGPYRQHSPTLTLFEFAMQQLLRLYRPDCRANAEADRSQLRTRSARIAIHAARIRKRHFG